jgi:hypothetical protein
MGYPFFGGVDDDVVLYREFFKGEGSSFYVASYKALAVVIVKGLAHPDRTVCMFLREDLRHHVVGNEFLFVEQRENPLSKGLIKSRDINLWEPCEYVTLPVAVG